jgi:hypothetical protein
MKFIKHQNIRGVLLLDTNLWLEQINQEGRQGLLGVDFQ